MDKKPTSDELLRRMYESYETNRQLEKGVEYHKSGQLQKAEEIYKKILKTNPNHSRALHLLGSIADEVGKTDMAIDLINKAIKNNPQDPVCYNDLGIALVNRDKLDEAISCFQKALDLKPDFAGAHSNMGTAFWRQGNVTDALSCYRKALELKPDYSEAYINLGNALVQQYDLSEAISCFHKAIEINPEFAEAYMSLGNALVQQYDLSEAISCFHKAIEINPEFAEAYFRVGLAYRNYSMPDEAISSYKKAMEIEPDFSAVYSELFHQLQRTCAWDGLERLSSKIDSLTEKALEVVEVIPETPFVSLTRHADPARNLTVAKSWSSYIARAVPTSKIAFTFDNRMPSKTPLTVGYLSGEFRNHPVAHAISNLFGMHDKSTFKVYCYSYGFDDGSHYRKRIEKRCDQFRDFRGLNHVEAAGRIFEDRVDILVDLTGHTEGNRLEICALRPSPIQVSYLGFLGTTGADFFDYIITDRIVTAEEHARFYSEKFVFMPDCFMINDNAQTISDKTWEKADFGLPEDSFIFCSFNAPYKIEPVIFDVWMKILKQVPDGVLWLHIANRTGESNLRREAEDRGVKQQRLVFAEKMPIEEHLSRLSLAKLALDTRVYNGGATTSNALWAGVPLITLEGGHFASRMSSSILTAVGLPDLITHSLEEYEALAVRLAQDRGELQTIRQRLAKNRLTEPLFDTPRFVRNLEKAYKQMYEIFVAGERPKQIEIGET
jgi:protein O-GlcNAc transferase